MLAGVDTLGQEGPALRWGELSRPSTRGVRIHSIRRPALRFRGDLPANYPRARLAKEGLVTTATKQKHGAERSTRAQERARARVFIRRIKPFRVWVAGRSAARRRLPSSQD